MTAEARLRQLHANRDLNLPLPGHGGTAERHRLLSEIARQDLTVARLAEAHVDAVAILAEAGRAPVEGALYGVWASEMAQHELSIQSGGAGCRLTGIKMFCTGAGLLDRALITVQIPERRLIDLDLRASASENTLAFDHSAWQINAFSEAKTATVCFSGAPVSAIDFVGDPGWYLDRPGFWHGACGPAACWAGGAIGLVDYALSQSRSDPHTLAHVAAMNASVWAMRSYLETAGAEIDNDRTDGAEASAGKQRALTLRHLVEQACSDVLRRFARAYGPRPLAFDAEVARRYQELDLYLRQSHAERDLEVIGQMLITPSPGAQK